MKYGNNTWVAGVSVRPSSGMQLAEGLVHLEDAVQFVGLEATREIIKKHPKTKILIVSNYADSSLVKAAFQAGALGYISKPSAFEKLIPAITAVSTAQYFVCESIKQQINWFPDKNGSFPNLMSE